MAQLPETFSGTQSQKFGYDGLVYRTDLKMSDLKSKLGEEQVIVRVLASAINDFVDTNVQGNTPIAYEGSFPGYCAAGEIIFAGSKLEQSVLGKYVQAITLNFEAGCCEYCICDYKDCMVFTREEWNDETTLIPDYANTMTALGIYEKILSFPGKNVISLMGGSNLSRYINRLLKQHEGYRVLNVIRNPKKIDELKEDLNTEHVVDMDNIEQKLKDFCGETPNPIIIDPLGGEFCQKVFHGSNYGATLIIYESIAGATMELNLNHVLWTEKTISYFQQIGWYNRKDHEQREELKNTLKKYYPTIFKTKLHKKYTQDKLADALKELHGGITGGSRILIVPVNKENPEN